MRTFTIEDFSGSGQYLVKIEKEARIREAGALSTLMYKIGYTHGNGFINRPEEGHIMLLISMSDGYVQNGVFDTHNSTDTKDWEFKQWNSKQDLCDYLNNLNNDEMRFATQEEVVRVVMYQRSRWR